jgi:hypothetical protein
MPDARPPEAGDDAAWVTVATPLAPPALVALTHDPQRLLRVNSQWTFLAWETLGPERVRFAIDNASNGRRWETEAHVERLPDGLRLEYAQGLKASTLLRAEAAPGGSLLRIVENYDRLPAAERTARLAEVDRSLTLWGRDLYRHLRAWSRWSGVAPWRWYVERRWLPMKPQARRIVRLLFWTTVVELALIGLLIAILVAERG